jgi:membrane protease YdiL (CAAX protease family)
MVLGIGLLMPDTGLWAPLLTMAAPVVTVGLITLLRTPRGARRELWSTFGLRHAGFRSWPVAFALGVLAVFVIPFGVADLLGSAHFLPWSSISVPDVVIFLVTNLALVTLMTSAEEIGWRSYLLPRMQSLLPRRNAAIAVGFVHGLFHLPMILFTNTYDSVGSRWIVAPAAVLTVTAAGVMYAWLKDRSGSMWPVAFAHSTINTFVDGAGLVVIAAPVALTYTATESGLVTLAATAAIAAVLLVRGRTWEATHSAAR